MGGSSWGSHGGETRFPDTSSFLGFLSVVFAEQRAPLRRRPSQLAHFPLGFWGLFREFTGALFGDAPVARLHPDEAGYIVDFHFRGAISEGFYRRSAAGL